VPFRIGRIHHPTGAKLAEVGEACGGAGGFARPAESREKDRDQQRDDANDDEQLNEGEGAAGTN
jgi:hypothetical protein